MATRHHRRSGSASYPSHPSTIAKTANGSYRSLGNEHLARTVRGGQGHDHRIGIGVVYGYGVTAAVAYQAPKGNSTERDFSSLADGCRNL